MNRKKAWQLARVVGNEIFMESTLEMAGSQRARILERYERNIDEARRTSFITKFMTSFLLAFLAIGPAMTLVQAKAMLVNPVASNTVLFVIAISLALYYGMAFFFIMFFKMITLGSFMAGNAFKFLGTLPLSYKEIEQIAMSTYLRINLSEIITIIVSVPVVGLAITGSFMFFVASLAASIMTITLANYAMINIASTIAKHISRAGSASRLVIAIRLLTTMGYVIGVGSISMVLVFSLDYVQTLLITGVVSSDVMNILLPIIPFPFSGSYISALSLMPLGTVDAIQITMIFTGFAFFALIVFGMARSGRKKLRGLSRIEIQDSNVKARAASTVV
nr:hypothetical protein [Candidatus Sigynarchaeota archaeon]